MEIIGTTGEIIDLFNDELTQEEWNAIATIHRMTNRLNIGIRFDWNKSIDVKSETTSQIVDESVFIKRELKIENLIEPIQNLIGLIDTPIGRRKYVPEVIENIKILKNKIEK